MWHVAEHGGGVGGHETKATSNNNNNDMVLVTTCADHRSLLRADQPQPLSLALQLCELLGYAAFC